MKRIVSALMVLLVAVGVLPAALNVRLAKADWTWTETITINADGSISPSNAPIASSDNITYTLTDNIVGHVPQDGFAITIGRGDTTFDGAGYAVRTTVTEFQSTGIYWGVANVTVQNVTIQNFYHGILLYDYHAYSLISGNNITDNYAGIRLFMSSHVTISRNVLAGNSFSLVLDSLDPGRPTYNNTVYENDISASAYGILVDKAQDNKLYHNHMEAGVSVSASGYANSWDDGFPSGGNYWSDYEAKYPTAQEIDESGIWDTPYVIDADNVDGFPLINPWQSSVHDVAIEGVTTSKTGCLPRETLGEGQPLDVNVTVTNQGDFSETFTVALWANETLIAQYGVVDLTPGATLLWELGSVVIGGAKGNIRIKVNATLVVEETDVGDNTFFYGYVFQTLSGDVDGDRDVDIFDIVRMAGVYGLSQPDPQYDPNCDLDGDGDIDIFDIVAAAGNYGDRW